jgi:hypothetical protein
LPFCFSCLCRFSTLRRRFVIAIALVILADWAGELLNGWSAFNSLKFWE